MRVVLVLIRIIQMETEIFQDLVIYVTLNYFITENAKYDVGIVTAKINANTI
jgi:hypothetical protein